VDNRPESEDVISVRNHDGQVFKQRITTSTFSNLKEMNGIALITTKTFANAKIA
jgi:hypothetical protein